MPRRETESFPSRQVQWDDSSMKTFNSQRSQMSRTLQAIERHLARRSIIRSGHLGSESVASNLVIEWQQHGPETLSGLAVRKLRLGFAPTQAVITASAAG